MISHSICQIDISYCHLLVSFPYTHFHALNLFPTNNLATRFDLGAGGLEDSPRRSNRASGFYHKQGFHLTTCRLVLPWSYIATVDGSEIRNNQLIDRWFISWFLGFYIYTSQCRISSINRYVPVISSEPCCTLDQLLNLSSEASSFGLKQ